MGIRTEHDDRAKPTLIAEPGDAVGFLDAPGLDADTLPAAIDEALETLGDGSVLTVYNDDPAGRAAIEELCDRDELELLATIRHPEGGTTYTIASRDCLWCHRAELRFARGLPRSRDYRAPEDSY